MTLPRALAHKMTVSSIRVLIRGSNLVTEQRGRAVLPTPPPRMSTTPLTPTTPGTSITPSRPGSPEPSPREPPGLQRREPVHGILPHRGTSPSCGSIQKTTRLRDPAWARKLIRSCGRIVQGDPNPRRNRHTSNPSRARRAYRSHSPCRWLRTPRWPPRQPRPPRSAQTRHHQPRRVQPRRIQPRRAQPR